MSRWVVPIVEGHGEVQCVPALLHRMADAEGLGPLRVNPPIRVKAASFLKTAKGFRSYFELAAAKAVQGRGLVLILLDCDDDCAAEIGPKLLRDAAALRPDVPVLVVLALREYESWFLAAAKSLRGVAGLPLDLEPPASSENIRDAKGWLGERMEHGYDPIVHQLPLSRRFDLQEAQSNASFRRFVKRLGEALKSVSS